MSEIEMTIDAVRQIANRTMGAMQQQAQSSSRVLGDVDLPASAFGGWPQGVALGHHHRAAHEVFAKTLEGVLADLEEFAQNLRDTADSSERSDEEVQASLLALGKGYRDHTFRSQRNYSTTVEALSGRKGVDAADLAAAAAEREAVLAEAGDVEPDPAAVSEQTGTSAEPAELPDQAPPQPAFE